MPAGASTPDGGEGLRGDAASASHLQQCTDILELVLQQVPPRSVEDVQWLASLELVCSAWRGAVRRAAPASLELCTNERSSLAKLPVLAAWLPSHAGLIGGLELMQLSADEGQGLTEQLLTFALQMCAAAAAAEDSLAAAAPAALPPPAARVPRLRLRSFVTDYLHSPEVLAALPAQALTRLELHSLPLPTEWPISSQRFSSALGGLTSLQELVTPWLDDGFLLPGHFVEALGRLPLTRLAVGQSLLPPDSLHHLPTSLVQLQCQCDCSSEESSASVPPAPLDLSRLSALRSLELGTANASLPGSALPAALTALTLLLEEEAGPAVEQLCVAALQQLAELSIRVHTETPDTLRSLAAMPSLTQLQLDYTDSSVDAMLAAAPCWCELPQLRALKLERRLFSVPPDGYEAACRALLRGAAAASSLTRLELGYIGTEACHVPVCPQLCGLRQLADLTLRSLKLPPHDVLQLTALAGTLTRLRLIDCVHTADDVSLAVLAARLSKLRHLAVVNSGLRSLAALPAIALGLRDLAHLRLSESSSVGYASIVQLRDAGLQSLTPLTNLTALWIPNHSSLTSASIAAFCAAVPGLVKADFIAGSVDECRDLFY